MTDDPEPPTRSVHNHLTSIVGAAHRRKDAS